MVDAELINERNNMEFKILIYSIFLKSMIFILIKKMIMCGFQLKLWNYIKLNYQCNNQVSINHYFNKNELYNFFLSFNYSNK